MLKWIISSVIMVLMLSGCAQKAVVTTEYVTVPTPVWQFQKMKSEIQGKLEINLASREHQRVCTPYLIEATDKLYVVIDALEAQFDEYEKSMTEYNKSIK